MSTLPIDVVLPELKAALAAGSGAVLAADPGAGKTTRVPLALRDEPWLNGLKIVMLEPRRLAARSAAEYMARKLGERVGETVGYRMRMDTRVGPATVIEVITEGILTRMLQSDPALEGVGLVVFDEFHERSLHADLGLALCLEARSALREDLRILVMSATMDAEPVAALLGGAPVIVSKGRAFPVETHYAAKPVEERMEQAVARAVRDALNREEGDILVFLPGAGEIRRVQGLLSDPPAGRDVTVVPLHGSLPLAEQDRAIAPAADGKRKVVLATSIAETSLTVEGIRVIVDSGLMRVPRFSPRTGMSRLVTVPVSAASADQRRGRAGRLGPGVCYRLWTEAQHRQLSPHGVPELLEADLAPLMLELAAWGLTEPAQLAWLDLPPAAACQQARELLAELGALQGGAITAHGRRMAELGMHPRLAHMVLAASPLGLGSAACELAAVLGERDPLKRTGGGPAPADLSLRLEALRRAKEAAASSGPLYVEGCELDLALCRRIRADAEQWKRQLAAGQQRAAALDTLRADAAAICGILAGFAYPDRIGRRKEHGRFLLANGRGAALSAPSVLGDADYIVAAELDDQGTESRILLAAALDAEALESYFGDRIRSEDAVVWDAASRSVRARRRRMLGAILIGEQPMHKPDPELLLAALIGGIRAEGPMRLLPWSKPANQLRQRMLFLRRYDERFPDVSEAQLGATLEQWLGPHLYGMAGLADLQRLQMASILESMLGWEERRRLDEQAPTHIAVPSGSRIPVDYSDPEAPAIHVRLQEMFGLTDTPRIGGGRVPLTLHLLSPAQRPVQVTRDLASFWSHAYFEVKKDLKGRYPKHYWPDDPLAAQPTNRAKPRL